MAYHEEYWDLMSAALDGALTDEERAKLEAHLAQCPDCKQDWEDLQHLHAALLQLADTPVPAPPEGLSRRILAAVEEESKVIPLPTRRPTPWRKWGAMAAALALVLFGGWSVWRGQAGPDTALPESYSLQNDEASGDLPQEAPLQAALFSGRDQRSALPSENGGISGQSITEDEDVPETIEVAGAAPEDKLTQLPTADAVTGPAIATTANGVARSAREALEALLDAHPMPQEGQLMETDDFLGWQTPYEALDGQGGQQTSTRLRYEGLTPNGLYHEFRLYTDLLDDPDTDEGHQSTLNLFAVPVEGGGILTQRQEGATPEEAEQLAGQYAQAVGR